MYLFKKTKKKTSNINLLIFFRLSIATTHLNHFLQSAFCTVDLSAHQLLTV